MSNYDVVIVGAGMGGLSAAIDLAVAGYKVLIVERSSIAGGKVRDVMIDGEAVAAGPTTFTMRWVFDELLDNAGTSLEDWVGIRKVELLARHAWDNGEASRLLDLYADIDRSVDAIAAFASARDAEAYRRFCSDSKAIFETLKKRFISAQKPTLFQLPARFGLAQLERLSRNKPFENLWNSVGNYFQDKRLQQLFSRYATAWGSSPYQTAGAMMLIAHMEQDSLWTVPKGMSQLAITLANVATNLGVEFRYDTPVIKIGIDHNEISNVILSDNERITTKNVIANCDPAALASGLFGPQVQSSVSAISPSNRSLSAVTWSCHVTTNGFPLAERNVFFSNSPHLEYKQLFKHRTLPSEPTVSVFAQDRKSSVHKVTEEKQRLLITIDAPAIGDRFDFTTREINDVSKRTFDLIERCGLQIDRDPSLHEVTTPANFDHLFPATGGALFGLASHGWDSSFKRPGAKTKIKGLYLAGGSTHPGSGVSMAALSGRLAATALIEDRAIPKAAKRTIRHLEAAQ